MGPKLDPGPDDIVDMVLVDASIMLEQKYGDQLAQSAYFNISRLSSLLGSPFTIARQAIQEGYVIQDCELCDFWDRTLLYCSYYNFMQTKEERTDYFYQSLCPALKLKR